MKRLLQIAFCLFLLTWAVAASTTNELNWRHSENRVDADIHTWNLQTLLEEISAASGWDILVEPGSEHQVSTKFSNLTIERALPRLLGKLSYALLPQTNGPPRFCVYTTSVGRATEVVRRVVKEAEEKNRHKIPNELVITLDPASGMTIEELAKMLGGQIVGRLDGLNSYLLRFENEEQANAAREKLQGNSSVAAVDSNYRMDPPVDSLVAPGAAGPFNLKATAVGDPNNLIVGLIDSHVQQLDPAMQAFLLSHISIAGDPLASGGPSHGTSMAQALLQALASAGLQGDSRVKILPVDVYGPNQTTSTFDVARGIAEAMKNGAMVINLSLGSSGDSQLLRNLIADASKQGVIFFAAAGNTPVTTPTYPAAYPEVMAVTAGDANKNVAPYANRGSFIDLIGPGGVMVKHDGKTHYVGGTSVATAYVSGLAMGAADLSGRSLAEVQKILLENLRFVPPAR